MALAVQAAVVLLALVDGPFALRLPIGLVYALAVPGFAVVGLLRLFEPSTEAVLSIMVSIALGTAAAQIGAWLGAYSLGLTLGALSCIATPCLLAQLTVAAGEYDGGAHRQWTRSHWA